jgi:hypothetical protein
VLYEALSGTSAIDLNGNAYDGTEIVDYNATNLSSLDGANSVSNITSADFVDFAGGDYMPATGGALDGAGTDLSAVFNDDIAGNTREVPWEIGAYEIPEVGPTGPTIDTQPIDQTVTQGQQVTFTSAATSSGGVMTSQWYEAPDILLVGETSDTLQFVTTIDDNGKQYFNRYTDDNGSTDTNLATLTVEVGELDIKNYDTVVNLDTTANPGEFWDVAIPPDINFGTPKATQFVVVGAVQATVLANNMVFCAGASDGVNQYAMSGIAMHNAPVGETRKRSTITEMVALIDKDGNVLHSFAFEQWLTAATDGVDGIRLRCVTKVAPVPYLVAINFVGGEDQDAEIVISPPLVGGSNVIPTTITPDSILSYSIGSNDIEANDVDLFLSGGMLAFEERTTITQACASFYIDNGAVDNEADGYIADDSLVVYHNDIMQSRYSVSAITSNSFTIDLVEGSPQNLRAAFLIFSYPGGGNYRVRHFEWPTTGNLTIDVGYRPQTVFTNTLSGITARNTLQKNGGVSGWTFANSNRDATGSVILTSQGGVVPSNAHSLFAATLRVQNADNSIEVQAVWVPSETGGTFVINNNPPTPVLAFGIINGVEQDIPVVQVRALPDRVLMESAVAQIPTNLNFTGNLKPWTYADTGTPLPAWASLDPSLGVLTLAPQPGDAGTTTGHQVTVTDTGANTAPSNLYSITVIPQETYTGDGAGEFRTPGLLEGDGTGSTQGQYAGDGAGEFRTPGLLEGEGTGTASGQETHTGVGAGEFRTPGLLLGDGSGTFTPQSVYEGLGAGEFRTPGLLEGEGSGLFTPVGAVNEGIYVGGNPVTGIFAQGQYVTEVWAQGQRIWMVAGQEEFTTPGGYTWTCPTGVTSISVLCIGGGGGGGSGQSGNGGGGGGLAWKNNIAVVPGNTYNVFVGAGGAGSSSNNGSGGQGSRFESEVVVGRAGGGGGGGGGYTGDGGGNGGNGGDSFSTTAGFVHGGGGGGAGGYSGNGGSGGSFQSSATAGAGGGGGGGGCRRDTAAAHVIGGNGGGVGLQQEGSSGGGGSDTGGAGGAGSGGSGQSYGGGGGGGSIGVGSAGASGAVRIIWGPGRSFPNNAADV